MRVSIPTTLQRSFGVHPKNARGLVARGLVEIDGETVLLEGMFPELAEVRGKSLAIPGRRLLTYPWGSPRYDGHGETAEGQLTLT